MRLIPVLATAALVSGCATNLSTLQTARPTAPGHVQVTGGTGFYLPLGPIFTVIGQGVKQKDEIIKAIEQQQAYQLSEEDQQELLTAGIALAVFTPSQGMEIGVRTGVAKDLDIGLRYSVTSLRLDAKYRLLHTGDPDEPPPPLFVPGGSRSEPQPPKPPAPPKAWFDVALGLGVSRYLFENPAFKVLEFLHLDDFSRWDVEVPLYISAEFGEVLKLFAAPKYIYSRTSFDETLVALSEEASEVSGLDVTLPASVQSHFFGASAGIGLGYRYVHLLLELTAGYTVCKPNLFGRRRDLGGVTLYPALGLNLAF